MAGWDWSQILTVGGKQYAAKRAGSTFVELSRNYVTDEQVDATTLNIDIRRAFTAHVPHESGRPAIGPIMAEGAKGIGTVSGDGDDPMIGMAISTDNGNTWSNRRPRSMGAMGNYDARAKWNQCGRGRRPQSVFYFDMIEPVKLEITGIVWGEPS